MQFEWDEEKNRVNRTKHKISFETACFVFDDPLAVSIRERTVEGEQRWQTIGSVGGIAILLVVHTFREINNEEIIRIISARKATPRERTIYTGTRWKTP